MQLSIHTTYEEMSLKAAEAVIRITEGMNEPLLCFPSGSTPVLFLKHLVDHFVSLKQTPDWYFIGLDEWIGFGAQEKGSCRQFLDQHFFKPLSIPENRIFFFDGTAADPETECRKAEQWIDLRGNIKICVLGLGQNGHLGFNEPGSDPSSRTQVVDLSDSTKQIGQKYFNSPAALSRGITLGLKTIMDSSTVFLLVNGSAKAPIVSRLLEQPVSRDLPASVLREHPDCWFYLDKEAAGQAEQVLQV